MPHAASVVLCLFARLVVGPLPCAETTYFVYVVVEAGPRFMPCCFCSVSRIAGNSAPHEAGMSPYTTQVVHLEPIPACTTSTLIDIASQFMSQQHTTTMSSTVPDSVSASSFSIGSHGRAIPSIGFGTFQPDVNPTHDVADAVLRALHAGYRHIDTAWMYGDGDAERGVGEALRRWGGPREDVFIVTKLYASMREAHSRPSRHADVRWEQGECAS